MEQIWQPAAVFVGAALVAVVVGWFVGRLSLRIGSADDQALMWRLHQRAHRPFVSTLVAAALLAAVPTVTLDAGTRGDLRRAFVLCVIAATAWFAVKALFVAQDMVFARVRIDVRDNRRARRVRTQISILRSLTAVTVSLIAIASMLMTFQRFRAFGASLLASAGIIGIIAGVASQTALKNVFAGLQLAFSDALRLDDVVVVESEWGRVESLNLMTVTLQLWDERRLVLPTSYFTTTPFQNWTRTESRVIGSVVFHLDYRTPLPELRAHARQVISDSPLWDRRDWVLQVVDTTPNAMVVRVLASAADASSAWDLRCDIREALIAWLVDHAPQSLPRLRTDVYSNPYPDEPLLTEDALRQH